MSPIDPRTRILSICALTFVAIALLTRIALLAIAARDVSWDASLAAAFALGCVFDVACAALVLLPLGLVLALLPARWFSARWSRRVATLALHAGIFALFFGAVAELAFWEEFGTRFNFIAVDYLVYTREVVGNIRESYPLGWIVAGLGLATLGAGRVVARFARRTPRPESYGPRLGPRWKVAVPAFALALLALAGVSEERLPAFANNYNRELAKNGLWSLFAAFRSNELDYAQFYQTDDVDHAFARLRQELVEDGSSLLRPGEFDSLRYVAGNGAELRPNVIQITVESLSAKFLGTFEPSSKLTPTLDALAPRSLVFERCYATGTRTDRGMEALTLSVPPTPGRSLVKRPHNEQLFTLGSVFRSKGYDTAFLYGGYGYFDNMNDFFGENGYRIVDRRKVSSEDVTFANAWGACDEDLYRWTLREADAEHAQGKPFHFFVMTTSNHRPYTYPAGKIDLAPKESGRAGAVKYTDYAIGQFLAAAATRPWYRNTVFVIVADHCASSAGRSELEVANYHIPLFVFAPGGQVAPGRVSTLTSQMDYAPTLLGLLGWSYPSRFLGHDVRRLEGDEAHALLGNYQKLAHLEKGRLVVFSPRREASFYDCDLDQGTLVARAPDEYALRETIAFYQAASELFRRRTYRELDADELARYSAAGEALARREAVRGSR